MILFSIVGAFANVNSLVNAVTGRYEHQGKQNDQDATPLLQEHSQSSDTQVIPPDKGMSFCPSMHHTQPFKKCATHYLLKNVPHRSGSICHL